MLLPRQGALRVLLHLPVDDETIPDGLKRAAIDGFGTRLLCRTSLSAV